jgi:dienelactone hydrolase
MQTTTYRNNPIRAKSLRAMRRAVVALATAGAIFCGVPVRAADDEPLLHNFSAVAISPDGTRVAAIESDDPKIDGEKTHASMVIRPVSGGSPVTVTLPCGTDVDCTPSSPAWSPDSATLSFVLKSPKSEARTIESVDAAGSNERTRLSFTGTLVDLRYSHGGRIAVLATPGAHKEPGATQAAAPMTGEIGARPDEQRIATLDGDALHYASPADLYVYEYDWLPDGSGFAGTAAPGDGDDNWWIAKLYAFAGGAARVIYAPSSPRQQLASPRVSPDGASIAFIGGIMSDFGSTGGDVFVVPVRGGHAVDRTPDLPVSATALCWSRAHRGRLYYAWIKGANIGVTEIAGGTAAGSAPAAVHPLSGGSFSTGSAPLTLAADDSSAVIVQDFARAPELATGPLGTWKPITRVNAAMPAATRARAITWHDAGYTITGWLLEPLTPAAGKRPLITSIHGGPSAAFRPAFIGRGTTRALLRDGYAIFEPNPRGSFGAGEAFTAANVRDFGYGDLRDVLAGVDAVEKLVPIDDRRLGITGYSYGGYMTMWTVTQTHRFAAAVAGAGISDWLSYYGENGIDRWMIPFFGASVYDDPAVYARSAPITYITHVKTPTFVYVGDRDVECPMPQTQEFWHALQTFGVPVQFVVYPGQGHGLRDPAARADAQKRTLAWFDRYLRPGKSTASR